MNLAACLLEVVEEVKNMNKPFPSDKFEALALLYVENLKNISAFSPEGLLKKYNNAYDRLREADAENPQKPIEIIR